MPFLLLKAHEIKRAFFIFVLEVKGVYNFMLRGYNVSVNRKQGQRRKIVKRKMMRAVRVLMCVAMMVILCAPSMTVRAADSGGYGDYVVTVYNEQNGLPTGEANVVLQISDGYVWIGSYGGLIRYDGPDFKNYSEEKDGVFIKIDNQDDHSFLCIRDFAEDSHGCIYAASTSGLAKIEGDILTPISDEAVAGETV